MLSLGACLSLLCLSLGVSLFPQTSLSLAIGLSLTPLCLSLGVSLFPQTSVAIGLSLTPRNVSVWLAEQKRVQHTDYIQRWSLTRMLLLAECFETLPARVVALGNHVAWRVLVA